MRHKRPNSPSGPLGARIGARHATDRGGRGSSRPHCQAATAARCWFCGPLRRGRDDRSDGPWQWRGASQTRYYFAPYEVRHPNAPDTLSARLAVTEGVIVDWCFERVQAVVLLEELHTACELLLEHLVNQRSRRLSFAELVDAANDAGMLSRPLLPVETPWLILAPANGKDLLIQLKDYRKNARHRADMSFEPWLKESWEPIALLIERLAQTDPIRRGGSHESG